MIRPEIITSVIVHAGTFHADDALAAALVLTAAGRDIPVKRYFTVPEGLPDTVIVADIGRGKYDHHQADAKCRPDGSKYAACGLLYEEFEKLSPFNRPALLMKALVAEEDYATTQEIKWQSGIEPLNMLITTKGGIQYEENSIDVKESGAQLCVRIPTQKNSEIYLYLDNIQFENGLGNAV